MAKFVGIALFTRLVEGGPLVVILQRRGARNMEKPGFPPESFPWGLQVTVLGGVADETAEAVDELFREADEELGDSCFLPEDPTLLTEVGARVAIFAGFTDPGNVPRFALHAGSGGIDFFTLEQVRHGIIPITRENRATFDARSHDAMMFDERDAVLKGFELLAS